MSNNQAQFQRIEAEERVLYEGEKRLSRGVVIGGAIGTGVLVTAIAALYYSHKSSAQTAQIGTLQSSVAQLQGTISQEQSYISQIPSIETTLQQLKTGQAANAKVLAQIESQIGPIVTPLDEAITAIQGISSAIAGLPTDLYKDFPAGISFYSNIHSYFAVKRVAYT